MKRLLVGFVFLLTACALTPLSMTEPVMPPLNASYPDLGSAPELTNDTWLNVDSPLRLTDLRGKVVALEMWTFG